MEIIKKYLGSAIVAGICIALGGVINLKMGGIIGAIMFSFGLLAVVHYGLSLYTGTAGFVDIKKGSEWWRLVVIICGNIIGCMLIAGICKFALSDVCVVGESILNKRLFSGPLNVGLLAVCCGFIMTTAVEFGRKQLFLPLLFGVPLFILSGFVHSIADAFYFLCSPVESLLSWDVLLIYLSAIIGNFIGCNIYRALVPTKN